MDGRPLVGVNAIAGEWGHNMLGWPDADEWPGPPCYCGRTGCIETFLCGRGLELAYGAGAPAAHAIAAAAAAAADSRAARPSRSTRAGS